MIGGVLSDTAAVIIGVPQRPVLGQILFRSVVNTMTELMHCEYAMFAYHVEPWIPIRTTGECMFLQKPPGIVLMWSAESKIPSNLTMFQMVNIGPSIDFTQKSGLHQLAWTGWLLDSDVLIGCS